MGVVVGKVERKVVSCDYYRHYYPLCPSVALATRDSRIGAKQIRGGTSKVSNGTTRLRDKHCGLPVKQDGDPMKSPVSRLKTRVSNLDPHYATSDSSPRSSCQISSYTNINIRRLLMIPTLRFNAVSSGGAWRPSRRRDLLDFLG